MKGFNLAAARILIFEANSELKTKKNEFVYMYLPDGYTKFHRVRAAVPPSQGCSAFYDLTTSDTMLPLFQPRVQSVHTPTNKSILDFACATLHCRAKFYGFIHRRLSFTIKMRFARLVQKSNQLHYVRR